MRIIGLFIALVLGASLGHFFNTKWYLKRFNKKEWNKRKFTTRKKFDINKIK